MTTVKSLAIIALLVGGTSLAMAQNGPATGGLPPVAGGAGGNPAAAGPPGPALSLTTQPRRTPISGRRLRRQEPRHVSVWRVISQPITKRCTCRQRATKP